MAVTPHYADDWLTVYGGDCRAVLATLPAESVHCVVTSPPYWGLRDYGTAAWDGGDADCDHSTPRSRGDDIRPGDKQGTSAGSRPNTVLHCRCGARRIDNQLGLEPTPEEYVANMVSVFREVRRVLRRDGTLWLNLGDSYFGTGKGPTPPTGLHGDNGTPYPTQGYYSHETLKQKDLVGIPWRVAFALQADGWYLRSDIIWAKPNPMPESVTDRPTKSHEYLFLFAKSERYYFDADAVREAHAGPLHAPGNHFDPAKVAGPMDRGGKSQWERDMTETWGNPAGRNIRSVWTIPTQPYPGAHFAVFPPKLVEPCIKAGTSERGVCAECGAPWRRVVDYKRMHERDDSTRNPAKREARRGMAAVPEKGWQSENITTGWALVCEHAEFGTAVPAIVLDPFAGSGTTGLVAQRLSRRALLIDLNPEYLKQQLERNAAVPLGLVG